MKRFQTDRHLPVTGKLDAITLAAWRPRELMPQPRRKSDLILADAVHTLVHTTDAETGAPGFLAATNNGLVSQSRSRPKAGRNSRTALAIRGLLHRYELRVSRRRSGWAHRSPAYSFLATTARRGAQVDGVPRDVPVNVIAQDPQRPDRLYRHEAGAVMSADGGATWSRRGGNLPFGDFTSILINPRNGDEIFAGNAYQTSEVGGGVYRTTDGGQTWARIDPKGRRLPSQRIWALAFDAHDQNVLFVGFSLGWCVRRSTHD